MIHNQKGNISTQQNVKLLFREIFVEFFVQGGAKKSTIFFMFFRPGNFFLKMTLLGVIRCGESIARIHESRKRLPDPDSGK
jgi:hypothetical protein